jgi:hypothetical protein
MELLETLVEFGYYGVYTAEIWNRLERVDVLGVNVRYYSFAVLV